ncbi:MAG: PolC-type DNA polymerase III [Mycoplasmoidaceae bacterium]
MKDKFLHFFTKSNILSDDEFNLIKDNCVFSISNIDEIITIEIEVDSLIEPKLFFKILDKKNSHSNNELKIILNVKNIIYSADEVFEYIKYYVNKYSNNNLLLKNILTRKKCEIENSNLIIFYLNLNERETLNNEKNSLLSFFSTVGIHFNEIVFVMDEKNKEIELYKTKKFETIIFNNKKDFVKENIKTRKINVIGNVNSIVSLVPEQMNAIVCGEVFKIDSIQLSNNKTIYKFFITDYSDSILIKSFINKGFGLDQNTFDSIKVGTWIKAKINLQIDKYEKNQLTGIIRQLNIDDKLISSSEIDNSEIKRVEYINHTKMTAFEGLADAKELADKLIGYNHKYLAITDKFNCQIFPSIYNYKKYSKKEINLIYGVQTFFSKSKVEIVTNPINTNISTAEYVIFDIETTSLYPLNGDIIEFGGIKFRNGVIIDQLEFFIKTDKPLSIFTKKLTGIDESMIAKGMDIKDALIQIKNFFGNAILIAHNGKDFDIKFINKKMEENSIDIIENSLIDTMLLSRAQNPKFKSHSLANISKKLGIFYNENEAHRAMFDAEILLKVWKNMMDFLDMNGINNLIKINENLNSYDLVTKNRDHLITLYAKNQEGLRNLYELISRASTKKYNKCVLFEEDILYFKKNILVANSPTEGNVIKEAFYGTDEELKEAINFYDVIFVSPVNCFDHEINRGNLEKKDIQNAINRIIKTCELINKKVIASSDTYYINEEDQKLFDVYVHTKGLGGKRHRIYSYKDDNSILPKLHYRTTNELLANFDFLGKEKAYEIVVENSNKLINEFDFNIIPVKNVLSSPSIPGAREKLEELVEKNMILKYGENPHVSIKRRINRELKSIIDNGYSVIYWFSHLLVKKSLDDGYVVGSRGSVGSSLVASLVHITDVNPLPAHYLCNKCKYFKYVDSLINSGFDLEEINCPVCNSVMSGDGHNIPFETFMGFDGDKVPDIDLNFSAEYQSKAHDFIRDTFGKENVLRAGTIGTVAEKTAFGYVKNYFEEKGQEDVRDAEIVRIASKCQGVKRTTGQHPGGIIVIPNQDNVFNFTPYNFPADDHSQDWYTTHFSFEYLHDSLLKFDILGHDSPTVIKMLESTTGISSNKIPKYDSKVMKIFRSSKSLGIDNEEYEKVPGTIGLPEFGTNFVKEMLLVTKPKNFSDLVRISGLSHGTNVWNNNAKDLIEKNNLDISEVISSRDDIMVYLMSKSIDSLMSFQIMENVRKGKGITQEQEAVLRENGIHDWYIDSCNKIKYLFPKAHATAYVDMAWKIAWYKLYHPLHFYSSFFSIRSTVFDLETIIMGKQKIKSILHDINTRLANHITKSTVKNKEIDLIPIYEISLEMIERGYSISNIDLNISLEDKYLITHNSLIPPFSCLDGLGGAVAKSIVEAREKKLFTSKDDLMKRTKISKTHLKKLADLGVLNNLFDDDQISLFE